MRSLSIRSMLAAACCLVASVSHAQNKDAKDAAKPPAAAPVPATPERTTASFGDWLLRCEASNGGSKRVCEVAQIVTVQGQTSPIAQIAIGRLAAGEATRLTIVLPVNIALQTKAQLVSSKNDGPKSELTWQSCTAAGCFASAEISKETMTGFGGQSEPGRIMFRDSAGRDIALQLSFRGLNQALAALAKEG